MLATSADAERGLPADGERWAYEVKWDGWRVIADLGDGRARLWSRSEREITAAFPELAQPPNPATALLDGEVVILVNGVPSFTALADRIHVTDPRKARALAARNPATLIAFDVLRHDGADLMRRSWQERREVLEGLDPGGRWQISPVYDDVGLLVHATLEQGLEGVVAKRRGSEYRPGVRSSDWRKLAHRRVQSVVVGGWRPEINDRGTIGALLIGVPGDDGRLRFAGRMGSGLTAAGPQAELRERLGPLQLERSPFGDAVPRADAKGATWVEPVVVVDARHLGRTENGRLRQPVFRGIRSDLRAEDVRYE
ncbi:hypothetical protein JCM9957A_28210 [Kineosporia succinea]